MFGPSKLVVICQDGEKKNDFRLLTDEVTAACRLVTSHAILEASMPKTASVVIPEACGITSQGKNGIW